MRIGNGNRPPNQLHRAQIVDVVAEVRGPLRRNALLTKPVANCIRFPINPVQHVDLQLRCPRPDHPVGLLGQDQHGYADVAQALHAHAVGPADPHGFVAVLVDCGRVVGVHPVEVGDHHVDIDPYPRIDSRSQRAGESQVVVMVDLHRGQLRHLHDRRSTEEPMPGSPETGRRHHVERPGLAKVRLTVLATRPVRRVMVDPARLTVGG
jgi:hypothetical protein